MRVDEAGLDNVSAVLDRGGAVAEGPDPGVGGSEDSSADIQSGSLHCRAISVPGVGVEQSLICDIAVVQSHPSPLLSPGTLPPTFFGGFYI